MLRVKFSLNHLTCLYADVHHFSSAFAAPESRVANKFVGENKLLQRRKKHMQAAEVEHTVGLLCHGFAHFALSLDLTIITATLQNCVIY